MNLFINKKSILQLGIICIILFNLLFSSCNNNPQSTLAINNNAPVIHYLLAQNMTTVNQVLPSNPLEIQCVATDSTRDRLKYHWSATAGEIQGEGDRITWISPDIEGQYDITVVVHNSKGENVTEKITIKVTSNPSTSPVIKRIKCMDCKSNNEASRWQTYNLICETSNPGGEELQYTWITNLGKIVGEGPMVKWTTSGQYGNALVTVIIHDSNMNKMQDYLTIYIDCCN